MAGGQADSDDHHDATKGPAHCAGYADAVAGQAHAAVERAHSAVHGRLQADGTAAGFFLDPHDSHPDAHVARDGLTVETLHDSGSQYLWQGVRPNYGVRKGIYMYEVKIVKNYQVKTADMRPEHLSILRCGFSLPMSSLSLGDTADGWGWGGNGQKVHNNTFLNYGELFTEGDVIGCILDMDGGVSFMKNGHFVGVGFDNVPLTARQTGMFPHLFMHNVKCKVNFRRDTMWFNPPGDQVKFLEEAAQGRGGGQPS